MKFSIAWVNDWLGRTIPNGEVVEALEKAGLEIEQVISPKPLNENIVVGLVKKVVQHPEADRLNICVVHDGQSDFDVVCGAPNVRVGLVTAFARIGAILPDATVIRSAKLRGIVSNGMLCSEQELGVGADGSKIIELEESLALGTKLCDIYKNDTILDIKTHANRFDLLSIVGLAREVSAITGSGLKELPAPIEPPAAVDSNSSAGVRNVDADDAAIGEVEAHRFMLANIIFNKVPSITPDWMMSRLASSGVRSISPVVDVTNYINLEFGQPLHAYDTRKLKLPIGVRFARNGEKLTTLDGIERKLTAEDLVVVDQNGPIGLAGVMGGAGTEVDEQTTDIMLEAATFDGAIVRKMAKRHGLRTEASARFERGLPVQLAPVALNAAVRMLVDEFGGELKGGAHDKLNVWPWVQRIGLRQSHAEKILGFEMSTREIVDTLSRLQIKAKPFDLVAEALEHLGKPYLLGASYKKNGLDYFDCSYLTEYLYSLIGVRIGFTALGQYEIGRLVDDAEIKVGDVLFYKGLIETSVTDHYYTYESGEYVRHEVSPPREVGHCGLYIGEGKVIQATSREYVDGEWRKRLEPGVIETSVEEFMQNPGYLGARRFVDNLDDFISVPAVPWWRTDLKAPEDLIEELVRIVGYDRVKSTLPLWRPTQMKFDRTEAKKRRVQAALTGAGLFEVMTYSFVSEDQLSKTGLRQDDHLKLKNPMSSEQAYLRSSMLVSHLSVAERNRGYAKDLGFYEISKVFEKRAKGEQPNEPLHLAVTVIRGKDAYRAAKGLLDLLLREMALSAEFVGAEDSRGVFAPGGRAEINSAGNIIGVIGRLDDLVVDGCKLSGEAAYFEVDLGGLMTMAGDKRFAPTGKYPSTYRDLSMVLDSAITWAEVEGLLSTLPDTHVEFLSDYYGGDLPAGKKSMAIRLHISFADRTPTEDDAVRVEQRALMLAAKKYGAMPRE